VELRSRLITTIDWLAAQPETASWALAFRRYRRGRGVDRDRMSSRPRRCSGLSVADPTREIRVARRSQTGAAGRFLDGPVIDANRRAAAHRPRLLRLIPGVISSKNGNPEAVARQTRDWSWST
jgi:hypothetical protein